MMAWFWGCGSELRGGGIAPFWVNGTLARGGGLPLEFERPIDVADRWERALGRCDISFRSYLILELGRYSWLECPTEERCLDMAGTPLLDMLRGTLLLRRCWLCLNMGDRWCWKEDCEEDGWSKASSASSCALCASISARLARSRCLRCSCSKSSCS